jgi:hypothetical protein
MSCSGLWPPSSARSAWSRGLLGAALVGSLAFFAPSSAQAGAVSSRVAAPSGSDWSATATQLRGKNGSRFEYVCPADGVPGRIWGTDVYTDDTSVCTAAMHAGKITPAEGGTVTIEIRPAQDSYTGSTRNGVKSLDYGAWSGSFVVASGSAGGGDAGVKMGGAGWSTTAVSHRGKNGSKYSYLCPTGGARGSVWGTNTYTDDSSVCTAAVHVGLVTFAAGGNVTIEIRPGQSSYPSFAHNGITTSSFGSFTGSFRFPAAAPIPGSPGGGGGGTTPTTTTTSSVPPATGTATGTVTVNGRPFTSGRIPYNAIVDVTDGSLRLVTDTGTLRVFGSGVFARFKLLRGTDKKKPIVELRLTGGDFRVCKRKTSSASAGAASSPTVRQLWADGKGQFRTNGRYSSATVRGTNWLTADRCTGTFTQVKRGVIEVSDRRLKRLITLRAGRTYLAKP